MKKSLFSIFAISTVISPIALTISCSENEKYTSSDIGGLNNYFNHNEKENKKLIDQANKIRKGNDVDAKNILNQKTILLTTGGAVTDQSFNQSVWEAMSKFSKEINNDENTYLETKVISQAQANISYDYAISNGYNIWILTGFQQGDLLTNWLKIGQNSNRFKRNNIKVISVDWFINKETELLIKPGQVLGLNFRTQEASFTTSYAASKLLKEINEEDSEKYQSKKTYFNSFAGGDFSGATNFNYGFYEGLRQFNDDESGKNSPWFARSTSPIELDTTFASTIDSRAKVEKEVNGGGNSKELPQIIFPVAGSLTANTIDIVKAKNKGQWVIGVDSDQSLVFQSDKHLLLTSAEKRIAIAIYKALVTMYGLSNFDEKIMEGFLPKDFSINMKTGLIQKDFNGSLFGENYNVNGGYKEGFVGVSKSTLDPKLTFKNNKTYAARFDEIVEETWSEFFGNEKQKGRFLIPVGTGNGLMPNDKLIEQYNDPNEGISFVLENEKNKSEWGNKEWNERLKKSIEITTSLKNVHVGYMTAKNKDNYFAPMVAIINNQGKIIDNQKSIK